MSGIAGRSEGRQPLVAKTWAVALVALVLAAGVCSAYQLVTQAIPLFTGPSTFKWRLFVPGINLSELTAVWAVVSLLVSRAVLSRNTVRSPMLAELLVPGAAALRTDDAKVSRRWLIWCTLPMLACSLCCVAVKLNSLLHGGPWCIHALRDGHDVQLPGTLLCYLALARVAAVMCQPWRCGTGLATDLEQAAPRRAGDDEKATAMLQPHERRPGSGPFSRLAVIAACLGLVLCAVSSLVFLWFGSPLLLLKAWLNPYLLLIWHPFYLIVFLDVEFLGIMLNSIGTAEWLISWGLWAVIVHNRYVSRHDAQNPRFATVVGCVSPGTLHCLAGRVEIGRQIHVAHIWFCLSAGTTLVVVRGIPGTHDPVNSVSGIVGVVLGLAWFALTILRWRQSKRAAARMLLESRQVELL